MKTEIPGSWEEMNDFQQREIVHIINKTETEDFKDAFIDIVQILLMKEKSLNEYLKMRKILRNIPISSLADKVKFIWEEPNLYQFPKIEGLREPAPRMGDLTIKQFSICDTLMHRYSQNKEPIYVRQLVACLYRLGDFDEQKLREVAQITDQIEMKEAERIVFIYSCIRRYIAKSYPGIFKSKEEDDDSPAFGRKNKYTPFSQIITLMAADELKLLGNLHECNETKLYDFMNAFLESKRIHKLKNDARK